MPTIKSQLIFTGGCLAGAVGMYYADPHRGAYRRAILRDQGTHLKRVLSRRAEVAARDLAHRTQGVLASARARLLPEPVADEILVARVASKIGRVLANPHALAVTADRGKVFLSGPLFNDEIEPLIHVVQRIPGVRSVEKQLDPHSRSEKFPALQGRRRVRPPRIDILQRNWSPAMRLLVGLSGGVAALSGGILAVRRKSA